MTSKIISNITRQDESLIDYINARVQISNEIKDAVASVCKTEELKKNHLLLKEGMVSLRIYFIIKGSARTFYYHDGKDITSWIYRDGQLVTSWSSFYAQTPSFENVELTEHTKVSSISYDDLQRLYARFPKMQEFGRIMVEEQIAFLDYFYKGFMFMTAKEKYELLLSVFPNATLRVNLGYIASFLGISQETLSRIRKRK